MEWGLEEHPSTELLRQYEEGTLPPATNHELERHLLDCEMCEDILTGMSLSDRGRTRQARSRIWQLVHTRLRRKKRRKPLHGLTDWRVALGLLMMFSSLGLILFYQYTRTEALRKASTQTAEVLPPSPEELLARTIDAALVLDIPAPPDRYTDHTEGLHPLHARGQLLAGQLVDAQGIGIAQALVQVQGSTASTKSDSAGRFRLLLPPGEHTLLISSPGLAPQTFEVSSPAAALQLQLR
jgi:hypothetical protein